MTKKLIIIPAYNEEKTIGTVINEIKKHPGFDVLVINDGSKDKTLDVIVQNNVEFISFTQNQGIGKAMKAGYNYAVEHNYDIAIQIDGDGQHDVTKLTNLTNKVEIEEYDFVIGSRYFIKTNYPVNYYRKFGTKYFSILLFILSGKRIHDATSGCRAANKKIIQLFSRYYPNDYPEVPTLLKLLRQRYRVCEIPVDMKKRQGGKSSISFTDSIFYFLRVSLECILITFCGNEHN